MSYMKEGTDTLYHETAGKQAAENETPEDIEALARRVYGERTRVAKIGREINVPYYLLNIRHPVVRAMYDELKEALGPWPLGDIQRTSWELGLLSRETRDRMRARYARIDEAAETMAEGGGKE